MVKHTHFSIMTATKLLVIFLLLHFNFCFDTSQATLQFFEPLDDEEDDNEPAPDTTKYNADSPFQENAPGSLGKYFVYVNCTTCKVKSDLVVKAKNAEEPKDRSMIEEREQGNENRYPHIPGAKTSPKSRTRTTNKGLSQHNRGNAPGRGGYEEEETRYEDYEEMEEGAKRKGHLMEKEETGETGETGSIHGDEDIKVYYVTNVEIRNGKILQYTEKTTEETNTGETTEEETTEENTGTETAEENTGEGAAGESTGKGTAEENTGEETVEETTGESTEEGETTESKGKTKSKGKKGKTTKENTTEENTTEENTTEENTTKGGKTTKKH